MKLLLLFTLISLSTFTYSGDWFTENIGQIRNQLGQVNNDVLYLFNVNGLTVTLKNDEFSHEVKKVTNSKNNLKDISKNHTFYAPIERIEFKLPSQPSQVITNSKVDSNINIYGDQESFEKKSYINKQPCHNRFVIFMSTLLLN